MFDANDRSLEPRFGVNAPRSDGSRANAAKRFQFAITWTTVTAHLELREAAELTSAPMGEPQRAKQLGVAAVAGMAVVPLIPREETRSDSNARWEMVVPKMVRADRVSQDPAGPAPHAQQRQGEKYLPISIPTTSDLRSPFPPSLSKLFAALGRRTRSLLAGPSKPIGTTPISVLGAPRFALANGRSSHFQVLQLNAPGFPIPAQNQIVRIGDIPGRNARRELLLSKITTALDSRRESIDSRLAMSHQDEPGSPYSI